MGGLGSGSGGPRPAPPRRGYTYSHPPSAGGEEGAGVGVSSVRFPALGQDTPDWQGYERPRSVRLGVSIDPGVRRENERERRSVYSPPPPVPVDVDVGVIHAPKPVMGPPAVALPLLVAPRVTAEGGDVVMEREETRRGRDLGQEQSRQEVVSGRNVSANGNGNARAQAHRVFSRVGEDCDKENKGIGEGWSYVGVDRDGGGGAGGKEKKVGVGLGVGMGREMGNVVYFEDAMGGGKRREKEKKGRGEFLCRRAGAGANFIWVLCSSTNDGFPIAQPQTIYPVCPRVPRRLIRAIPT